MCNALEKLELSMSQVVAASCICYRSSAVWKPQGVLGGITGNVAMRKGSLAPPATHHCSGNPACELSTTTAARIAAAGIVRHSAGCPDVGRGWQNATRSWPLRLQPSCTTARQAAGAADTALGAGGGGSHWCPDSNVMHADVGISTQHPPVLRALHAVPGQVL